MGEKKKKLHVRFRIESGVRRDVLLESKVSISMVVWGGGKGGSKEWVLLIRSASEKKSISTVDINICHMRLLVDWLESEPFPASYCRKERAESREIG